VRKTFGVPKSFYQFLIQHQQENSELGEMARALASDEYGSASYRTKRHNKELAYHLERNAGAETARRAWMAYLHGDAALLFEWPPSDTVRP